MSCIIYLPRGFYTVVSIDDFVRLRTVKWGVNLDRYGKVYVCRKVQGKRVYMHREITNCPPGLVVDHINGNTLDNRRTNLRICTERQNRYNSLTDSLSGYKGVSLCGPDMYRARIQHPEYGEIYLGRYKDPQEAADAYDKAALLLWGEYAWLNCPLLREEKQHESAPEIPFP